MLKWNNIYNKMISKNKKIIIKKGLKIKNINKILIKNKMKSISKKKFMKMMLNMIGSKFTKNILKCPKKVIQITFSKICKNRIKINN